MSDLLGGLCFLLGGDRFFLCDLSFGLEVLELLTEGGVPFLLDPVDPGGDFWNVIRSTTLFFSRLVLYSAFSVSLSIGSFLPLFTVSLMSVFMSSDSAFASFLSSGNS